MNKAAPEASLHNFEKAGNDDLSSCPCTLLPQIPTLSNIQCAPHCVRSLEQRPDTFKRALAK